jgi:2-C-methyl-D-erythritol 4-phosphate cytidylyltransferase
MNYAIIVAAGKSERIGPNVDKAFLNLGSKPVLAYSLAAFQACEDIHGIILVVRKEQVETAQALAKIFGCHKLKKVIPGGTQRQDSVLKGLAELGDEVDLVAVHDGARPCVTPALITETLASARKFGSGVAAVKIMDTIKEVDRGSVVKRTVDRTKLWAVQTPQTFKHELLVAAYRKVAKAKATVTDESSALELAGEEVHLVASSWSNLKITIPDDLKSAALLLGL